MGSKGAWRVSDAQMEWAKKILASLVAIPSVSHPASSDYSKSNLSAAAEFSKRQLDGLGFSTDLVSVEGSAPYVVAERLTHLDRPTVLFYAHYDVQPVDRASWDSDPFVLEERKGRLFGRGSSDDKAGIVSLLTVIRMYDEAGVDLPVNMKVLFEGEEEYGSSHMEGFLAQESDRLGADVLIVLDGLNRNVSTGSVMSSTRGIVNLKVRVETLRQPVHSGLGLLVPDPAMAMARLVAALADPDSIVGLKEGTSELTGEDVALLRSGSVTAEAYASEMGVIGGGHALRGDPSLSVAEKMASYVDVSILNMTCGAPNGGNSIQAFAECTVSLRILPGQDPEVVSSALRDHILKQCPFASVTVLEGARGWKGNLTGPFATKYLQAMRSTFPAVTVDPCGGALPLLNEFKKVLPGMEIIVAGMEEPLSRAHGHNESQDLGQFRDVINSVAEFIRLCGQA